MVFRAGVAFVRSRLLGVYFGFLWSAWVGGLDPHLEPYAESLAGQPQAQPRPQPQALISVACASLGRRSTSSTCIISSIQKHVYVCIHTWYTYIHVGIHTCYCRSTYQHMRKYVCRRMVSGLVVGWPDVMTFALFGLRKRLQVGSKTFMTYTFSPNLPVAAIGVSDIETLGFVILLLKFLRLAA